MSIYLRYLRAVSRAVRVVSICALAVYVFYFTSHAPARAATTAAPFPRENALSRDIATIFNRYSRYLDTQWRLGGWNYSVPSRQYKEVNKNSLGSIRMQATLASFYMFRTDDDAVRMMHSALMNAFVDVPEAQVHYITTLKGVMSTRSFHDAIGIYAGLRLLEKRGEAWSPDERAAMVRNMKDMYPWVVRAPDTENRALLGAAYSLAILNSPLMGFTDADKRAYIPLIRAKVLAGMKSIGKDHRYREGGPPARFSLHYHVVSALMLGYVGDVLDDASYQKEARAMMALVHAQFPLGRLSARTSFRPTGYGVQLVLLRALSEKYLGHTAWYSYWSIERRARGFIDPRARDRLVWKDDVDKTMNDDYSFATMADLFVP